MCRIEWETQRTSYLASKARGIEGKVIFQHIFVEVKYTRTCNINKDVASTCGSCVCAFVFLYEVRALFCA